MTEAQNMYRDRQDRRVHPDGTFDKQGRWYPSASEQHACCSKIRTPSKAYPYSLMKHCRSAEHVAALTGVPAKDLLRTSPTREGGDHYYKMVAVVDGRYFSIFDGETEYTIGEPMKEAARRGHNGGFYVYRSLEDARNAVFPKDSALLDAPRVALRVRAGGTYCRYLNKLAFSRVTPLEVVE